MSERKVFIEEIKQRLQFASTFGIFLVSVTYNFFNIYAKENADKNVLSFSIVVLFYLVSYIFFDLFKNSISEKYLKSINILIFTGFFTFIFPSLFFISGKNFDLNFYSAILYDCLLWIMAFVPVILFLLIVMARIFNSKNK